MAGIEVIGHLAAEIGGKGWAPKKFEYLSSCQMYTVLRSHGH